VIKEAHALSPSIWAYGYELTPPVTRDRLAGIQGLLDDEHRDADLTERIWAGRFINGDEVTHILIVSGTPDQDRMVNRKVAEELLRLHAGYLVTPSLEVLDAME
jgi:hypothetical protein